MSTRLRGKTHGDTHATRQRTTDFIVWLCPNDRVMLRPLFNVGARFDVVDVAGMMLDDTLPDGTLLRRVGGDEWLVYRGALHEMRGGEPTGRQMTPRGDSRDKWRMIEEVTG